MPLPEPVLIARGADGEARIPRGPRLGALGAWRVVSSPTTGQPTLIAEGRFLQHYVRAGLARAEARLIPATPPARIGRPTPRPSPPLRFVGRVAELTPTRLTLAEGEVLPA